MTRVETSRSHRRSQLRRWLPTILIWGVSGCAPPAHLTAQASSTTIFREDFETTLERWRFPFGQGHILVEAGGEHGQVLALAVRGEPVYALIEGSERWEGVRLEGDVLFPSGDDSYLGFIYRFAGGGERMDFGSLYIKNNGNYVQANEHHDTNVGRTFLPELNTPLEGTSAIRIGEWQHFALEVIGSEAHLYVGDMTRPALTLPRGVDRPGAFGFKPRNPGTAVWIDNIEARPLEAFSHRGAPIPDPDYRPNDFITDWSVLGPLTTHVEAVERSEGDLARLVVADDGRNVTWRPWPSDHRGAVLTGRVVDFRGPRRVAYFRASVHAERDREGTLYASTVDDLAIWVNGIFIGFAGRQGYAWWDAMRNEEHRPLTVGVPLQRGENEVIIRVLGGTYATGAFYVAVREDS